MNDVVQAPSLFRPVAHAAGDLVALGADGVRRGGDLLRDVRAVAGRLPAPGPGSEVLVVCGDRYHVAVAVLAAWERGHAVALPPNAAPETVRALRRRPGVVALLHDTDTPDEFDLRPWLGASEELSAGTGGEAVRGVGREGLSSGTGAGALAGIVGDRVIATVYTSGSTGAHQACPKTAAQLLGEAATLARCFAVTPARRVVATVPPHHLYGLLFSVLMPLAAGASFVRETPLHAETVAATARRHAADLLVSVPIHLRSLTVLDAGELPVFAGVFSSGAALPSETAAALGGLGLAVTEIYGASETGGIAWRRHLPGALEATWAPLPGVEILADASGRLLLRSPFLPPDAAVPFACEDVIEVLEGGRFRLLGRRDGVLKIGGKRVALAEVEQRLLAQPWLADAAVAASAVEGPRGQEILAAVVARTPGRDAELVARVRQGLLQWFDPVVVPRKIKVVPRLPREASGKLTRASLLALFERPAAREGPPRTEFVIREQREVTGGHRFAVQVPRDLAFFRGHFVGLPVLPGVAQLVALVLARARALYPELGEPRRIARLKFRRAIAPGDELELQLRLDVARRLLSFSLARAGEQCSAGVLDFSGEFARGLEDMSGGTGG